MARVQRRKGAPFRGGSPFGGIRRILGGKLNMTYDEIMAQIRAGLTGDTEKDCAYLQGQAEAHKGGEYGKEIVRECGRMMYEMFPDATKKRIAAAFQYTHTVEKTIGEATGDVRRGDLPAAAEKLETEIRKTEKLGLYQNDRVSEYYCFSDPIQEVLYAMYQEPKAELRDVPEPYAALYRVYGSVKALQGLPDEAIAAFSKSLRWNPADAKTMLACADAYADRGDMGAFAEYTKKAWRYAYEAKDVARCCRNMGRWFADQGLWQEAAGYYVLSMQYDEGDSDGAREGLSSVMQCAGPSFALPTVRETGRYAKEYGIPLGPDSRVTAILCQNGRLFYEAGSYEMAMYFLEKAYALAPTKEVGELLDKIEEESEDGEDP